MPKIRRLLDRLDALAGVEDVLTLGMGVHRLTGDRRDFWSVKISPNYRIIFKYEDGHVYEVDYLDPD